MTDTRVLIDRISAFRQRLEAKPGVVTDSPAAVPVAQPEAFRQTLRQISDSAPVAEGPPPPQLTTRARQLLQTAKELLDRQRGFTADPMFAGLVSDPASTDPLVAYHRETVAVIDSSVRMAQAFPDSPTAQLKLCDGLDGMLSVVKERLTVQERTLARRRSDLGRIDRLAAIYAAMHQTRAVSLNPIVELAEELLEEARQTKPLRFVYAEPTSTAAFPGGISFPAPARFLAAHAVNVAQVVARVVDHDFEWAGRAKLAVAAALLMDCGGMRIPAEILAKTGPLTPDEERLVEAHPQHGAELVMRHVSEAGVIAEAIATHHERADGTGYPVGLKGTAVPTLGRLLAVADVYAALCSPRPHRPAQDTRAALTDVLLLAEYGQLDNDLAEYLVHLSFYPVGSVVELTDGRAAVVAANHRNRMDPRAPGRPVVAVIAEADGTLLPRPDHIDLSATDRGGIARTLPPDRRRQLLGHRYPDLC